MHKRARKKEEESEVNNDDEEEDDKNNNDSSISSVTTQKTHLNERQFILKLLEPNVNSEEGKNMNIRVDGRQIYDFRPIKLEFDTDQMGHVWCKLGNTQVMAHVICNITEPYAERPTEGFLTFQIELHASLFDRNNKAYPAALQSRNAPTEQSRENLQEMSIEWSRIIERSLRGSRAIDTEALCLVAGEKVWSLKVVLNVVDMDGNALDCAHIAAITALLHFKRPEVTIEGQNVVIHSITEREPVPLSVHHIPICVTFAFFERDRLITFEKKSKEERKKALQVDELVCVDPCLREELMVDGIMTIAVNGHGELCAIQKGGGLALKTSQILKCAQIAFVKAQEITPIIKKALADDEAQRKLKKLPNYGKPVQPVGYKPSKEDTMEDEESGLSDISEDEDDMDEAFEHDLDDFNNNNNNK